MRPENRNSRTGGYFLPFLLDPLVPAATPPVVVHMHSSLANVDDFGLQPLVHRVFDVHPLAQLELSLLPVEPARVWNQ